MTDGALAMEGFNGKYMSFSAASRAITGTSRNGWTDWELGLAGGEWIVADKWRNDRVLS